MSNLAFHGVTFDVQTINNQIYITSVQLAQALGYRQPNAVAKIYNRNSDEFSSDMTYLPKLGKPDAVEKIYNRNSDEFTADMSVVPGTQNGNRQESRLFSLRGAHLVAMFARTPIAKEFRRWVLDVLDRETHPVPDALVHQLRNQRFFMSFTYDNKLVVKPLLHDEIIINRNEIPKCIRQVYDSLFPVQMVVDIARACTDRLEAEVKRQIINNAKP